MVQTYSLQAVTAGYPSGFYICHHGIKGQKWGVRRYQNPDGTLTEEGKKRYNLIQKRFTDPSGNFSTQRDTRRTQVKNAGIGLLGGGSIVALGATGAAAPPVLIAGVLGIAGLSAANVISGIRRREKARSFMEVTGDQAQRDKVAEDRYKAAMTTFGGSGDSANPALASMIAGYVTDSHLKKIAKAKVSEALEDYKSGKKTFAQLTDQEHEQNRKDEYKNSSSKEQKKILKQAMSKKCESPVDFSKYKTEIKNAKTKAEADAIINKIVKETMAEGDKLLKKYTFKTAPETNDALYYRYQPDFIVDDILTRYPSLKF